MSITQPAPLPTDAKDRTTIGLAIATACCSLPLLGLGGYAWVATARSTSDDPLVGLGYVMAVIAATPGLIALLMAVAGVAVRRRSPVAGIVLAAVGLGVAGLPLLVIATWLAPLPMF